MGKISPVSAKYIIHATIQIGGIVDKPDVIGAIFGQTEGLLGADLELRELQRSGRIGRIEVNVDTRSGKTQGDIIIPSSLDKAETSIVGAALEIIQRIGPCTAKIFVKEIEDVRISKRQFVIERAKVLLKNLMDTSMPDSQELADEVAHSVRVMEIQEFGVEKLPCGPAVEESDEITIVEGRADVLTLLKHGIKNAIAINGTSVPESILELCKRKVVTVFVDGDRGGNLIIKELMEIAEIDYVTRAPDGKEVEEITKKEIHKALRSRISAEQAKLELANEPQKLRQNIRVPNKPNMPQRDNREQKDLGATTSNIPKDNREQKDPNTQRDNREQKDPNAQRDNRDRSRDNRDPRSRDRPFQQRGREMRNGPQNGNRREGRPQDSNQEREEEQVSVDDKKKYSTMLESLIGTRGAYILNDSLEILGKVPVAELNTTIKSLDTAINAIVFDGTVDGELQNVAENANIKVLVGMNAKVKSNSKVNVFTVDTL